MSYTIPNERVKLGYDVVDENARVLQRIAPQLFKDEYERQISEQAARNECLAAAKRVRSLYHSVDDISYAEQQAAQLDIAGRKIRHSLLENIASAKTQEANLEEQIENRYAEALEERLAYNLDRKVFGCHDCEPRSAEQSG